jgi:hypothetical protein
LEKIAIKNGKKARNNTRKKIAIKNGKKSQKQHQQDSNPSQLVAGRAT